VFGPDTPTLDGFPSDIHTIFFRGENWKHGPIELPHFSKEQIEQILMVLPELPEPLEREPSVPNSYVPGAEFRCRKISHMVLAQSPGYTSASADALIPVIQQYFYPA
jgi:hypothetical protein